MVSNRSINVNFASGFVVLGRDSSQRWRQKMMSTMSSLIVRGLNCPEQACKMFARLVIHALLTLQGSTLSQLLLYYGLQH